MGAWDGLTPHNALVALDEHAIRLVELVNTRSQPLAERVVDRLQNELPAYAALPRQELVEQLQIGIDFVTGLLRDEKLSDPAVFSAFAELVRARTREGVDAQTVIRAIRISARDALDYVQTLAEESAIDTAATFSLTTALLDAIELIIEHISPADESLSESHLREGAERRCIVMIADGVAKPDDLRRAAEACDLDPTAFHHVVRAANTSSAVIEALRPDKRAAGIATVLDDEVVAVLATLPDRPLSFIAGAGPALPLSAGRQSFELAGRVLRTATRAGFSGVCTLDDVGLRAAVIADPAIGELLAARYLAPLSTLGDFGDQLLDSVRTYFASGQRIDEAAKALFVHPNTLRYRLARFEDTTRCDLHSAENIAEIWWVLTRSTM